MTGLLLNLNVFGAASIKLENLNVVFRWTSLKLRVELENQLANSSASFPGFKTKADGKLINDRTINLCMTVITAARLLRQHGNRLL